MANLKDLIVNGSTRLNSDVTISGKTTLGGAPTSDNEAATKKYVDDSIPSVPSPADADPLMDGTAAVGTSTDYAREDHVHPTDTSRAPLASPAFTGNPTAPTQSAGNNSTRLATTAFVNTAIQNARPDWSTDDSTDKQYILNRPEVRTSTGAKSLKLNDIDHNVASGEFSTSEGENTSAYGEASHAEGKGIINNVSFTVDEFNVNVNNISTSFVSGDFSGNVGDTIIFDNISGTYTVTSINKSTIFFTPSISRPKSNGGEILGGAGASGAYGDASHVEGCGTTAWGTSSHAEGSSDVTLSENDITVSFIDDDTAILNDHHDYLPVLGDRFEYSNTLYTVCSSDPGNFEFYFYPEFDTAPSGAQTITVYHFDSGAIGENSHVEGLNTIALNDNEHAEGRYNVSTVNEEPEHSTIHSIGIGDGNAYRRNAVEVSGRGEVYIKDVGGYNGENMNGSGVSDLATVIGTIPSPANSGKMKISANSGSAVDTLFNANSSSDTNAIKFIDGTNTQVTVTAASGSTPATVKYDFTGTIPAEPLVIEIDYDGVWGQVPQGTYQSIQTAIAQDREVIVKVSSATDDFIIFMNLSQADDANGKYTFYSGTNIVNDAADSLVSLNIYDDDTFDSTSDVILGPDSYFRGLLKPNAAQSDASILTHTNQPLATTAAAQTDDTKPVSAKNVYQLFNGLNTNTIKPVFSHFYDTDENFKAPSTASTYNTAEYCNRYFMKVIPDGAGEYWSVFYHVHIEVPDYTTKIFTDSYIEFYGNGDGLTCNKIWNTLSGTANYYHCAFWLTAAGLSTDYGHAIGESIMSSTARNLARTMSVEVFAYDGCTVELLPHLLKWSEWDGADSTNYKTATNAPGTAGAGSPSTYNSTTNGLQETSDADTVTTISLAYTPLVAGTYGMKQYSLVMQDGNGKWQSFTTTGGATGYSGGNFTNMKTMNPSGFRLGSRIYYLNVSSAIAADSTSSAAYAYRPSVDFRYTLNITTVASGTAGYRNGNLVANKPIYIVGHMGNDGLYYLDADADGNWWTQEPTLASGQTEDGKIYIRICDSTRDNYRGDPITDGYAFWFKDGVFCRYFGPDAGPKDVISLTFTHEQSSTSTDAILETTSLDITTLYDGLKIVITDISDSSTVGYRFGTSTTSLEINGTSKRIFGLTSDEPLTSSQIEPGTSQYTLMLQYSSSINYNSGGWIIIGQYDSLPMTGGTMRGGINMDGNSLYNIPPAIQNGQPVEYSQTLIYDSTLNAFDANSTTISNVPLPSSNSDVANKQYVDNQVELSRKPTLLQDTSVGNIDGSKDYNVAYVSGSLPIVSVLGFSTPMVAGNLCHIFVYCSGSSASPGTYATSTGYVSISDTICVGGQSDGTSNNNYVWINGELVHGGGTALGIKFFKIPRLAGAQSGVLEISVFYSQFTPSGGTLQHRTIIKVDSPEAENPI